MKNLIKRLLSERNGSVDECPDCGEYTLPAENKCADCVEGGDFDEGDGTIIS